MNFKSRWHNACSDTIGTDMFWRIAVDHRSLADELLPLIQTYTRGIVLDAGAGRMAWRSRLRPWLLIIYRRTISSSIRI